MHAQIPQERSRTRRGRDPRVGVGAAADQTSITRFIEDNWLGGERIDGGSFDVLAGSLTGMFGWRDPQFRPLILDPATGEPVAS
jgi:hypothetical protein